MRKPPVNTAMPAPGQERNVRDWPPAEDKKEGGGGLGEKEEVKEDE